MRPTMRLATVTKKNPNTTTSKPEQQLARDPGSRHERQHRDDQHQHQRPDQHDGDRQVAVRAFLAGRAAAVALAQRRDALLERRHDRGQRLEQGDEAARRDGARADLAHVGAIHGGRGVGERMCSRVPASRSARCTDASQVAQLDQLRRDGVGRREHHDERDEPDPREHAARDQDARDARTDDVADAQVLGRDLAADGRRRQETVGLLDRQRRRLGDDVEDLLQDGVQARDAQPVVSGSRQAAAALTCDQHGRARGPLGIGERRVLLDDQRPAQRDHHQHAQHAAHQRQRQDRPVREIADADALAGRGVAAQEQEAGQGEHDAGGDRFARRADRLHDVVLQDGRLAESLEQRDRQHRDRDRCRHRQPGLQRQVDRRRAEDDAEQRADDDRLDGELGDHLVRGDVGFGERRGRGVGRAGCVRLAQNRSPQRHNAMPRWPSARRTLADVSATSSPAWS